MLTTNRPEVRRPGPSSPPLKPDAAREALAHVLARLGLTPHGETGVVALTAPRERQGVTTLALALAHEAAAAWGHPTLLVEAHLRRPALAARAGLPPQPGLRDYLEGEADRPPLRPAPRGGGLSLLPAGAPPAHPLRPAVSPRWGGFLTDARRRFAFVFVDLPPLACPETLPFLEPIGAAVLVVARHRTREREVAAAATRLREGGVAIRGTVLSRG